MPNQRLRLRAQLTDAPLHATPATSMAQHLGSVQSFILILPHFVFGVLIAESFFSSQRKSFPVG
ncbi:MAG: hypothetical protein CK538_03655 [Opitutia bacterium]|nr:MAG: hypothetical protein CK538_03655 [Opitutae bacterium]